MPVVARKGAPRGLLEATGRQRRHVQNPRCQVILSTGMQSKLQRLTRLVGTDAGFYVLALHSFVEHYIRDVAAASSAEKFPDLVWGFRESLLEAAGGGFVDGINCLSRIGRQHRFTNYVRHGFEQLDVEEAHAATHHFVVFCGLVGLAGLPEVRELEGSLHAWDERTSVLEQRKVLRGLQDELTQLQEHNTELLSQLESYQADERALAELENRIERYTIELEKARGRVREKDKRVDQLRGERARLREERKGLLGRMKVYEDLERYVRNLGRFSLYTTTRMDYERALMRLTPEQEDAVRAIDRESDFLVRGGAGTGKSLILIEALRRSLEVGELSFESNPDQRAVLLTFTRTLAKFEDYMTGLLHIDHVRTLVQTVDTFVLERLQRIDPAYRFDFDAVKHAVAAAEPFPFLAQTELVAEIEEYLFGNAITQEEYVEDVVPRIGLRRRLSRGQREKVWELRMRIAGEMDSSRAFSRNYARLKLLDYLAGASAQAVGALRDVRTIYLDETQDLTAGDLMVLKALVTGHLIMAADIQQSIYGVSSPFARAGLRVSGRTRILRTNFRNTRQIHEAAQRFSASDESGLFAFRDGPVPELYQAGTPDELLPLLLGKLELFIGQLGYEPDNVCVVAPHTAEVTRLHEALTARGIPCAVITDREFEFTTAGAVRISTLHSSKGLDFPVVMVYLPYLRRRHKFDEETTERLLRNLIYVGFTRAMENLNVFTCPGDDPILRDVCRALRPQFASGCRSDETAASGDEMTEPSEGEEED
jgi:predicted nuclease with TOPRIM domain